MRTCSVMSQHTQPRTIAHQTLCPGIFRQEPWNGLPSSLGIKPASLAPPALAGILHHCLEAWVQQLKVMGTSRRHLISWAFIIGKIQPLTPMVPHHDSSLT